MSHVRPTDICHRAEHWEERERDLRDRKNKRAEQIASGLTCIAVLGLAVAGSLTSCAPTRPAPAAQQAAVTAGLNAK